jgi:hypothetical protein
MKKRILHLGVASLLALLPAPIDAQATNPPYVSQMPSVEQVMNAIKGADAMDTAARRMGAFWQLQKIVEALGNPRRSRAQLTPDEGRLIGQYRYGYSLAGQPFAHIDKDPSHPDFAGVPSRILPIREQGAAANEERSVGRREQSAAAVGASRHGWNVPGSGRTASPGRRLRQGD